PKPDLTMRAQDLRRRLGALVARHGASQLTSLEHAAVEQALGSNTAEDLEVAEKALAHAENRLDR
ncbi:MAG: hypothetical protein JNG84_01160, partial [Archangium sp.]|nr:hypothetical protein [Archangium sp.]